MEKRCSECSGALEFAITGEFEIDFVPPGLEKYEGIPWKEMRGVVTCKECSAEIDVVWYEVDMRKVVLG